MLSKINCRIALTCALIFFAPSALIAAEVKTEKIDAWVYECKKIKSGETCALKHVQVFKNKAHALTLSIFNAAKGDKLLMHFKSPLGVFLPYGIKVVVDDRDKRTVPFIDCNKVGCNSVVDLNEQQILDIRSGKEMLVEYAVDKGRKKVQLKVPLNGTSLGINKIRKSRKLSQKDIDGDNPDNKKDGESGGWFSNLFSGESAGDKIE